MAVRGAPGHARSCAERKGKRPEGSGLLLFLIATLSFEDEMIPVRRLGGHSPGFFFLYRSPYEGRLFCNRHGQQGTWGICDENGGIKSSCIKNRPLTGKGKKKMDRGCGYGGRCSPSVRSSENRKGSDPGIFRWRQYSFGVCRRSSRAGRKDHCSQCQCTAGRSDPSYAVYGEYPFPVCEDLREYKASGKIWKMV